MMICFWRIFPQKKIGTCKQFKFYGHVVEIKVGDEEISQIFRRRLTDNSTINEKNIDADS